MKPTPTLLATVALSASLLAATGANATLIPALGGQVVNDTDLNITWLANANLAATETFGLARNVDLGDIPGVNTYGGSYIYYDINNGISNGNGNGISNGAMTWGGALKWVAAMNTANYLGYHDWRLPTSDTSCPLFNCIGSEMGHLFYNELGGDARNSILTTHNANLALFQNVQPYWYWSGTEYATSLDWYFGTNLGAWYFSPDFGDQGPTRKNRYMFALAVRPGQVAAVPVPAAVWLLGSGLLGLIGVARRR